MSRITPDMKVRLQLMAGERDFLLELKSLPASFKKAIRATAASEPIAFTPDEAFCLFGYVGGEANRTRDKQRQHSLDALSGKIQQAMYWFADEVLLHPQHARAATRGEPSGRRKAAWKRKPFRWSRRISRLATVNCCRRGRTSMCSACGRISTTANSYSEAKVGRAISRSF
jgi:hypothetical protein